MEKEEYAEEDLSFENIPANKNIYVSEKNCVFDSVPKPIRKVHYALAWKLLWCNL